MALKLMSWESLHGSNLVSGEFHLYLRVKQMINVHVCMLIMTNTTLIQILIL